MRHLLALTLLALSACDGTFLSQRPIEADVDEIEARLSKVPCVGSMKRWARYYSHPYTWKLGMAFYQREYIEFSYEQAGVNNLNAGRVRFDGQFPEGVLHHEDNPEHKVVSGTFSLYDRSITLEFCGKNADFFHGRDHPTILR